MQPDAEGSRGETGGIGAFRELARPASPSPWRARVQQVAPYLVGAAMFAVAVWVLHSALSRYRLEDLHAELAQLTVEQVGLAILFTFLSFVALIGYEWSALGLVGKRMPLGHLSFASFCTQSIAHSTGFAFVIGATLRYHFYSDRGLGIADVAKVQMFFTATFTLGVATLAGGVVMLEPWRLAAATGLPPWLWRMAAATALALVVAYVVWGGFFHRPIRWRGRELVLPSAGATLTQIFFGVADLIAVAAALHVLLPAELGLGYLEVLAIFMASIVVGLVSHVPGSLGVFESAVVLLVQPSEGQTLPLIGALLAFRAVYYLLPLACGVALLAMSELDRWRVVLTGLAARLRLDVGAGTGVLLAALALLCGLGLIAAGMAGPGTASAGSAEPVGRAPLLGRALELGCGLALVPVAWGLWQRRALAWRWALALLAAGGLGALLAGARATLPLVLGLVAVALLAARGAFARRDEAAAVWQSPALAVMLAVTLASGFWLIARG